MPYSEIGPYDYFERSLSNYVTEREYMVHLAKIVKPFKSTEGYGQLTDLDTLFAGNQHYTPSRYYVKWDNGAVSVEDEEMLCRYFPEKMQAFRELYEYHEMKSKVD